MTEPTIATLESQGLNLAIDPLGATNISERVQAIISLSQQLMGLVNTETALLKSRRGAALRETEAEKRRLSSLYAREMRAITARPELLADASPRQKDILRTTSSALRASVATHVRTLARIRAVTEAMVVAIGEELSQRNKPTTNYKRPGGPVSHRSSAIASAPAFGFDRTV